MKIPENDLPKIAYNDPLVVTLLNQIELLQKTVDSLNKTIADLTENNQQLQETINSLNQTIRDLQEQLNKNSRNSSKPPSSDGYKKPAPKSLRTKTGKKQGGQKGHTGSYLSMDRKADEVVSHMPPACAECPLYERCKGTACIAETRRVVDIKMEAHITDHSTLKVGNCPMHGGSLVGEFPEDVKGAIQYGNGIASLAVTLNTIGDVSYKRIHDILGGMFDLPLSEGTIKTFVKRCAKKIQPALAIIDEGLLSSPVNNFDETGARVAGSLHWIHNASNKLFTRLHLSKKRGYEGMEEGSILPFFKGIGIHDFWKPYLSYTDITHAVCCAHLLRELIGIDENYPGQTWATKFIDLLLEMKKAKERNISKGLQEFSYYHLHKFDMKYDEIIKIAYEENPNPNQTPGKRGRKKRGKVLALIDRLKEFKASVCLFAHNFIVEFDNNQAERDLRMSKVKLKVSGCFRTVEGAVEFVDIMSYVSTANKHGVNAYKAIALAFSGTPEIIFES